MKTQVDYSYKKDLVPVIDLNLDIILEREIRLQQKLFIKKNIVNAKNKMFQKN